ncbi:hypothetical protein [Paenibacillus sp. sgz500958]|uniref:hypothetical protein n=1 Tax=Paenibacillus sp. sgz500958 TaxID=3242475 RepID=UPI0036D41D84
MNESQGFPAWLFIPLGIALLIQGTLLFRDARKRGKKAWFWGLWGITGLPTPTVVYLLVVVLPEIRRENRKGES